MGVAAAVLGGRGLMFMYIASTSWDRASVARGAAFGFGLWFVVDSAMSIVTGFGWNAVGNVGYLAVLLPPFVLLGWRRGAQMPVHS